MIRQDDIDKFYSDVEGLRLKFPVAAITRATGESKGNVSKILRRQLSPSESFLNRFYGQFPKSSEKVSSEIGETVTNLSESNRMMAEAVVKGINRNEEEVQRLRESVNENKEKLEVLIASFRSLQQMVLESAVKRKEFRSLEDATAAFRKKRALFLKRRGEVHTLEA